MTSAFGFGSDCVFFRFGGFLAGFRCTRFFPRCLPSTSTSYERNGWFWTISPFLHFCPLVSNSGLIVTVSLENVGCDFGPGSIRYRMTHQTFYQVVFLEGLTNVT